MKHPLYFPHDANAGNDPKILALRAKYSFYGYGVYWYIVEYLRNQPDFRIPETLLKSLEFLIPTEEVFNREITVQEIINLCLSLGLFIIKDGYFYSESLITRMSEVNGKIEELRDAGRRGAAKRWGKEEVDGHPMATHIAPNSNKSKVNESKLKEKEYTPTEIYNYYAKNIRNGASTDAIKNITNLLKAGATREELLGRINAYKAYLQKNPTEPRFYIQANNFFGRAARYKDYEPLKLVTYMPPNKECKACGGSGKVQDGEGKILRCACVKEAKR